MLFAEAVLTALEANGIGVDRVANTGAEAIRAAREHAPDLVLVDLGLPDRSGMSVGSEILEISPTTKVVVLAALDDDRAVRNVLRAGFHGYVTKDTPVSKFIQVIEAALAGQVVLPRRTAARVAGARSAQEDSADLLMGQLTSREREVLSLLVEGMSGQAMSNQLHISPNTVRTHVQSILTKLQVHSRLEAASFAVRHRMIASSQRGWESTGA
jgi:DNA-binding NarL/FixJ family response regulator